MSKVLDMEVMVQFIYTPYHFKFWRRSFCEFDIIKVIHYIIYYHNSIAYFWTKLYFASINTIFFTFYIPLKFGLIHLLVESLASI